MENNEIFDEEPLAAEVEPQESQEQGIPQGVSLDSLGFSKWEKSSVDPKTGYKMGVTAAVVLVFVLLFVFIGSGTQPPPPSAKPDVAVVAPVISPELLKEEEEQWVFE